MKFRIEPRSFARATVRLGCFALLVALPGHAHPGRLDAKGGHRDQDGAYHYHKGTSDASASAGSASSTPAASSQKSAGLQRNSPLQRNAIVLRVASEQVVRSETQWQTGWGDFSKDYINARILVIDLRQLGPGDSLVKVEWFFIGRDHDKDQLFIYDSGETTGSIAQGGVKLVPKSTDLVSNRASYRNGRLMGRRPWGWAVFVSQNGKALGETASVPELVKWTQDNRNAAPKPRPSARKLQFVPQAAGFGGVPLRR